MGFGQAVVSALTRFKDFKGRSARSEYWWFVLFNIIVGFVSGIIDGLVFGGIDCGPQDFDCQMGSQVVGTITSLALLVPGITLAIRRMHDVNRSGWWLLTIIPPIIFAFMKGTTGDNRFGPDPLGGTATPPATQETL